MKPQLPSSNLYTQLTTALQQASNSPFTASKRSDDHTISCKAIWTKRRIQFSIHFSVSGGKVNYPNFRVGRSKFLGAFLKQNSLLSQRGATSELSDLILSDSAALQLLEHYHVARIEWKENSLTAFVVVKKKRQESLKEIVNLFEKLGRRVLDELAHEAD
ncbi:MAG: hypothetical protein IPH24_17255 [Crocinitomicaceae bacterium]|nr:hypothetical protein [Crocinitomicaceae bacterium]